MTDTFISAKKTPAKSMDCTGLIFKEKVLGDKIDLGDFVNSLSPAELAVVLVTAGQRVAKLKISREAIAA